MSNSLVNQGLHNMLGEILIPCDYVSGVTCLSPLTVSEILNGTKAEKQILGKPLHGELLQAFLIGL